jgi:hypothetical protein
MKMTNDKITIREGNTEVTYTVTEMTDEQRNIIDAAANVFLQMLVQASPFSGEDSSENQSRSVEYWSAGSHMQLLEEAADLITKSRTALAEMPETTTTETIQRKKKTTMSIEVTATQAGELYSTGKSVAEVAAALNVTYSKARRLIQDSGTPVRDASTRLKGRTRKIRS